MRSALLLVVLGMVTVLARMVAHLETDWLWFRELGQEKVFWTLLTSRWLAGSLGALVTTTFLLLNFWVVARMAPPEARFPGRDPASVRMRHILVTTCLAVSVGAGFFVGRSLAISNWQQIVLWLHRRDFGVTDPLAGKDVGFFVFSLPLYEKVAQWLFLIIAIALVSAAAGHVATGAIRTKPPPVSATRGAHAHLLVLAALLMLVIAWQHWLGQFSLELRNNGTVPGAGYTEVNVVLPWLRVLVWVTVAAAAVLLYAAVRRSWSLPAIALVIVAVAELVNPSILPSVVQRLLVDPQTLARERTYIAHSVRLTRRAWALNGVAERAVQADATISDRELRANRDVLRNIQLWDTDVLQAEIDQQQSIGSYYAFPHITVDRYTRGGKPRVMIVAERELDLSRLNPSGRTWANDRLAYTHGYGLVAVPAGGVDSAGKPTFVTSEFGSGRPPTQLHQPRTYFGVQPRGAQPWVVSGTNRDEVERPLSGEAREPDYHYDGSGGIPLSGLVRKAFFAFRLGDLNLLLSETLGDNPRLILHRDVNERLRQLAPFLHWDRRPQVTVVDGRIQFLAHGYTTSDSFPYSAPVEVGGKQVNYMRGSVVATVDAFSGRMRVYATGADDPILDAWQGAFPTLFTPASQMPEAVRAHLRYPQELFDAQSRIWATYHVRNVDDFYTRRDAWKRPSDISGPVQKVGTLSNRFKSGGPRLRPNFVLARMPGEDRQRFMLTSMFTPYSGENLSGYLAGTLDGRGQPRLTQLSLPRSRRVLGPSQVGRQILATPGVSDKLRLLNQETTDLGDRAVNTVQLGVPRVVPIADQFLYVQPIYVTEQASGVTKLRFVTVYLNGQVGYGRNLDQALRRARRAPR